MSISTLLLALVPAVAARVRRRREEEDLQRAYEDACAELETLREQNRRRDAEIARLTEMLNQANPVFSPQERDEIARENREANARYQQAMLQAQNAPYPFQRGLAQSPFAQYNAQAAAWQALSTCTPGRDASLTGLG